MTTLYADTESLKFVYDALSRMMREGTHLVDNVELRLSYQREKLDEQQRTANRILYQVHEHLQNCQIRLSHWQEEMTSARAQVAITASELSAALSALVNCESYVDEDGHHLNCTTEAIAVASAERASIEAQNRERCCEGNVYRAQELLASARNTADHAEEVLARFQLTCDNYMQYVTELRRELNNITGSCNYRMPYLREHLGYKIGVLEMRYLLAQYGGFHNIPAHHHGKYASERRKYLLDVPYDYRLAEWIRGSVQHGIAEGKYHIRTPVGLNVGHRFGRIHGAWNFRLEDAWWNNRRGGKYGR